MELRLTGQLKSAVLAITRNRSGEKRRQGCETRKDQMGWCWVSKGTGPKIPMIGKSKIHMQNDPIDWKLWNQWDNKYMCISNIINKSALMHCPSGNWNYFNFIREWHSDRQKSKFKRILQRRQSSNLNLSTDMTLYLTGVSYIINHRATERSGSKREGWWFAKNAATAFIADSNKKGEWKRNRIGISGILSTLQRPQQHCHPG